MVESWVMTLTERNDLSPVTCNHILATLKVMLSETHRIGVIATDPVEKVAPLPETARERKVLTLDEIRALVREDRIAEVWSGSETHYTLSLLAASTGVRMGEA